MLERDGIVFVFVAGDFQAFEMNKIAFVWSNERIRHQKK
jgi:hypothetical protein